MLNRPDPVPDISTPAPTSPATAPDPTAPKPAVHATNALQVDLAEFAAIRSEIVALLNLQSAFLGMAIAFLGMAVTITAALMGLGAKDLLMAAEACAWIFASASLPFLFLAILYADVTARIGRAATYIETRLRPRIARQSDPEVLGWERYVHNDYPKRVLLGKTDRVRYWVFWLPAVAFFGLSWWMKLPSVWWDNGAKAVNLIALIITAFLVRRSHSAVKEIVSSPHV